MPTQWASREAQRRAVSRGRLHGGGHRGWISAMDAFVAKHAAIRGVLSCFDRVLFRGYVPLMSGYAMAEFLKLKQVQRRTLKAFLLTQPSGSSSVAVEVQLRCCVAPRQRQARQNPRGQPAERRKMSYGSNKTRASTPVGRA